MPWVTPANFTDGETLTATRLNELANAVRFLNGVGGAPAVGENSWYETVGAGGGSTTRYKHIRHKHNYLKIYYWSDGIDSLKVYVNGVQVYNDGAPPNGHQIVPIDISAQGIAALSFYEVRVEIGIDPNKSIELKMVQEESA